MPSVGFFFYLNTLFYMATYKQRTKRSSTSCPCTTQHIRCRASSMQLENSEKTCIPYATNSTRQIPRREWTYRCTNTVINYREPLASTFPPPLPRTFATVTPHSHFKTSQLTRDHSRIFGPCARFGGCPTTLHHIFTQPVPNPQ